MARDILPTRQTGATAMLRPNEPPTVVSATGGKVPVTTHVTAPGFNPLDLLYASLASCVVLSVRIAAQKAGVLAELGEVRATVAGEKARDAPSRIVRFHIEVEIDGPLSEGVKRHLANQAEAEICTVSNTLRAEAAIEATYIAQ